MDIKKMTVGQIIAQHRAKGGLIDDDIREYSKMMEKDTLKAIYEKIDAVKDQDFFIGKDFYISVHLIMDKVLGVPVWKIFARISCSSPFYNTYVYKYHRDSASLELLFMLPSRRRYREILKMPGAYITDKRWEHIAKFVILDSKGELMQWIKKENGNKKDGVLRVTAPTAHS